MALELNQVVPWGRTRAEYERMFDLGRKELSKKRILDCGGGPASLTAELAPTDTSCIAVDPIYIHSGDAIRARFETTAPTILNQVAKSPQDWVWSFHRNPQHLFENRQAALTRFLEDYSNRARANSRYVAAALPSLPFPRLSFDLALCSHLLFLYSNVLTAEFHVQAALELCRVAREVRIFPLLDLSGQPSSALTTVRSALASSGWTSTVVKVDYELQRGGNSMLRIVRD